MAVRVVRQWQRLVWRQRVARSRGDQRSELCMMLLAWAHVTEAGALEVLIEISEYRITQFIPNAYQVVSSGISVCSRSSSTGKSRCELET